MKRLLDLYCGAGGAGEGYRRAGFEVVGVDLAPQKRYKPGLFVQADAIDYLREHGHEFDAIHASPPCQFHTQLKNVHRDNPKYAAHLDMIPITRQTLIEIGKPYIIENVMGAKKHLINPVMLCGTYFDLHVYRHRLFESNISLTVPEHTSHEDHTPKAGHKAPVARVWSGEGPQPKQWNQYVSPKGFMSISGHISNIEYARYAMGIDWMIGKELVQSIPPAYTEYLGKQLMEYLK